MSQITASEINVTYGKYIEVFSAKRPYPSFADWRHTPGHLYGIDNTCDRVIARLCEVKQHQDMSENDRCAILLGMLCYFEDQHPTNQEIFMPPEMLIEMDVARAADVINSVTRLANHFEATPILGKGSMGKVLVSHFRDYCEGIRFDCNNCVTKSFTRIPLETVEYLKAAMERMREAQIVRRQLAEVAKQRFNEACLAKHFSTVQQSIEAAAERCRTIADRLQPKVYDTPMDDDRASQLGETYSNGWACADLRDTAEQLEMAAASCDAIPDLSEEAYIKTLTPSF